MFHVRRRPRPCMPHSGEDWNFTVCTYRRHVREGHHQHRLRLAQLKRFRLAFSHMYGINLLPLAIRVERVYPRPSSARSSGTARATRNKNHLAHLAPFSGPLWTHALPPHSTTAHLNHQGCVWRLELMLALIRHHEATAANRQHICLVRWVGGSLPVCPRLLSSQCSQLWGTT